MAYRMLEVTLLSAKDLKNVNRFTRMEVYAVATISGDPLTRQCTPPDPHGGRNPIWNATLRFAVPPTAKEATGGCLHILLLAERTFGADRDVGEVIVPLAEVLTSVGDLGAPSLPQLASYQVRKVHRTETRGVLNLMYRLGPVIAPQPPLAASRGHVAAPPSTTKPPGHGVGPLHPKPAVDVAVAPPSTKPSGHRPRPPSPRPAGGHESVPPSPRPAGGHESVPPSPKLATHVTSPKTSGHRPMPPSPRPAGGHESVPPSPKLATRVMSPKTSGHRPMPPSPRPAGGHVSVPPSPKPATHVTSPKPSGHRPMPPSPRPAGGHVSVPPSPKPAVHVTVSLPPKPAGDVAGLVGGAIAGTLAGGKRAEATATGSGSIRP